MVLHPAILIGSHMPSVSQLSFFVTKTPLTFLHFHKPAPKMCQVKDNLKRENESFKLRKGIVLVYRNQCFSN